ncbi:hypothetical protein NQ318_020264 [Aromia moschata]|uniref:Uncharacterized protein n=1 Tax=Aromia moschata TaxID=1265417 RepID=A0AAV8ZCU0_9CUCU|nr:hypothetical protein NQ318_020264 [Aromia moschata]
MDRFRCDVQSKGWSEMLLEIGVLTLLGLFFIKLHYEHSCRPVNAELDVALEDHLEKQHFSKVDTPKIEAYAMLKEVYGNECLFRTHKFLNGLNGLKRDVKRSKTIRAPDGPQRLLDMVTLKGARFESVEAVKAKATEVLNQLTEADFEHCFQQ